MEHINQFQLNLALDHQFHLTLRWAYRQDDSRRKMTSAIGGFDLNFIFIWALNLFDYILSPLASVHSSKTMACSSVQTVVSYELCVLPVVCQIHLLSFLPSSLASVRLKGWDFTVADLTRLASVSLSEGRKEVAPLPAPPECVPCLGPPGWKTCLG